MLRRLQPLRVKGADDDLRVVLNEPCPLGTRCATDDIGTVSHRRQALRAKGITNNLRVVLTEP